MKWLLDNNLSTRLGAKLAHLPFEIQHVTDIGLDQADDQAVWVYGQQNHCVLVTKDSDFNDLMMMRGFPPKIIWLRIGNCTSAQIVALLSEHQELIETFCADDSLGILELG